jgi:hypothetical protein
MMKVPKTQQANQSSHIITQANAYFKKIKKNEPLSNASDVLKVNE